MTDNSDPPDQFIAKILPPVVPRRNKKTENNSSGRSGSSGGNKSNPTSSVHFTSSNEQTPSTNNNNNAASSSPTLSSRSGAHHTSSATAASSISTNKLLARLRGGFQVFGEYIIHFSSASSNSSSSSSLDTSSHETEEGEEGSVYLYKVLPNESPTVTPTESQQTWPAPRGSSGRVTSKFPGGRQHHVINTVELKLISSWDLRAKKVLVARGMLFYLDTHVKAVPLWIASSRASRSVVEPKYLFKGANHEIVDFCLGTSEDGTLRVFTVDTARMIRIFEFEHMDHVKLVNAFSVPGDITAIRAVADMILTIGRMPETSHDGTLTTASGYIRVWDHVGNGMNVLAPAAGHPTPIVGMTLTRMAPIPPFSYTLPAKNVITWSRDGSIRKWKLAHSSFKSKELVANLVLDEMCQVVVGHGKNKAKLLVVHNLRTKQLYITPHKISHSTSFSSAASPTPIITSSASQTSSMQAPSSPGAIRTFDRVTAFAMYKSIVFLAAKTSKTTCKLIRVERSSRKNHDYESLDVDGIVNSICAQKKPDPFLMLSVRGEKEPILVPWPQRRVSDD